MIEKAVLIILAAVVIGAGIGFEPGVPVIQLTHVV